MSEWRQRVAELAGDLNAAKTQEDADDILAKIIGIMQTHGSTEDIESILKAAGTFKDLAEAK